MENIDQLAERLGIAASEVWPTLVKAAVLEGILTLVVAVLCAVTTLLLYRRRLRIREKGEDSTDKLMLTALVWVGIVIFGTVAVLACLDGVAILMYPEAEAIHDLIPQRR